MISVIPLSLPADSVVTDNEDMSLPLQCSSLNGTDKEQKMADKEDQSFCRHSASYCIQIITTRLIANSGFGIGPKECTVI